MPAGVVNTVNKTEIQRDRERDRQREREGETHRHITGREFGRNREEKSFDQKNNHYSLPFQIEGYNSQSIANQYGCTMTIHH